MRLGKNGQMQPKTKARQQKGISCIGIGICSCSVASSILSFSSQASITQVAGGFFVTRGFF
jgi:hypothetical protein